MGQIIINFRRHFEKKPDEADRRIDELTPQGITDALELGTNLDHAIDLVYHSPSYRAKQSGVNLVMGNSKKYPQFVMIDENPLLREIGVSDDTLRKARETSSTLRGSQEKLDAVVNYLLDDNNIPDGEEKAVYAGTRLIQFIGDAYLGLQKYRQHDFNGKTLYVEAITHSPVVEAGMISLINSGKKEAHKAAYKVTYVGGAFAPGRTGVVTLDYACESFGRTLRMRANGAVHEITLSPADANAIRHRAGLK